jgi:hypothetical protein
MKTEEQLRATKGGAKTEGLGAQQEKPRLRKVVRDRRHQAFSIRIEEERSGDGKLNKGLVGGARGSQFQNLGGSVLKVVGEKQKQQAQRMSVQSGGAS